MFIVPFTDLAYQKMAGLKEQYVCSKLFKLGKKTSKCWKYVLEKRQEEKHKVVSCFGSSKVA